MQTLFCLLIFLSAVFISLSIIQKRTRSPLAEQFTQTGVTKKPEEKVSFWDILWNVNHTQRKQAFRLAETASGIGFIGGLLINPQASIFFAFVGFILAPRIRVLIDNLYLKKQFFKQFPRAVSELAAIIQTGTLLDGFRSVEKDYPVPVSNVFGFIAESMDNGVNAPVAVRKAQKRYGYPGLDKLATAVQIITELGGGEKASETLKSASDHIRFIERIRGKVDTTISGIFQEMFLTTGIIIFYFFIVSGPWTEGWANVVKHPGVVFVGFMAIAVGWYLSIKKINKFKNTSCF